MARESSLPAGLWPLLAALLAGRPLVLAAGDLASVRLPPPIIAPEALVGGAAPSWERWAGRLRHDRHFSRHKRALEEALVAPSAVELIQFGMVRALRAHGHTCKDGKVYPPNTGEFEWDCRLWRAARLWTQRMATENFIAHEHEGSTSCTRTFAQGFPKKQACGENIAGGGRTPRRAIEILMGSNDHCENLMMPAFNKLGIGYSFDAAAKFRDYWVQSFGDWHHGPDQTCIGGQPAPTAVPGCKDIDTFNCATYKEQGYCTYSPNVIRECKETCNISGCAIGSPPPLPPEEGCLDDPSQSCAYYLRHGFCNTSESVRDACGRTCGVCAPRLDPGAPANCTDEPFQMCAFFQGQGWCETDPNVQEVCGKTCDTCGLGAEGGDPGDDPVASWGARGGPLAVVVLLAACM